MASKWASPPITYPNYIPPVSCSMAEVFKSARKEDGRYKRSCAKNRFACRESYTVGCYKHKDYHLVTDKEETESAHIPWCTSPISHNVLFCNRNAYTCAHFCCKIVHCGIFVQCIVGFVRWDQCNINCANNPGHSAPRYECRSQPRECVWFYKSMKVTLLELCSKYYVMKFNRCPLLLCRPPGPRLDIKTVFPDMRFPS